MPAEVLGALAAAGALVLALRRPSARRPGDIDGARTRIGAILRRGRARLTPSRTSRQRREAVREAVAALVAELTAGHAPSRALERAFAPVDLAPRARAAVAWGGDVVAALRSDGRSPGCQLMLHVAACWSVAHGTGAGLAASLQAAVDADRDDEDVRTQLGAHLSAPRATARMLAGLPLIGLILGVAMGGDPLAWLLTTPLGFGCLVGGVAFTAAGLIWTSRIAARVEALL